MKIRCLNCEHGYTPLYSYGSGEEVQSCDYGLGVNSNRVPAACHCSAFGFPAV